LFSISSEKVAEAIFNAWPVLLESSFNKRVVKSGFQFSCMIAKLLSKATNPGGLALVKDSG
jgi:hypothetical protein